MECRGHGQFRVCALRNTEHSRAPPENQTQYPTLFNRFCIFRVWKSVGYRPKVERSSKLETARASLLRSPNQKLWAIFFAKTNEQRKKMLKKSQENVYTKFSAV